MSLDLYFFHTYEYPYGVIFSYKTSKTAVALLDVGAIVFRPVGDTIHPVYSGDIFVQQARIAAVAQYAAGPGCAACKRVPFDKIFRMLRNWRLSRLYLKRM